MRISIAKKLWPILFLFSSCERASQVSVTPTLSQWVPVPVAQLARVSEIDVLHYQLRFQIDPEKKQFRGETQLRFKPLIPSFRTLQLDCGDYRVQKVTWSGQTLAFEQNGERLRVGLAQALSSGQECEVKIDYEGVPSRGIYFIGPYGPKGRFQVYTQGECEDIRYVFPCYDFPNDKATSETWITVPSKYKTIAAGALVSSQVQEDQASRTDHWKMDVSHSSYLTTLAVGEFCEVKDEWQGIPVQYFAEEGDEEKLRLAFGKTPKAMQFFSDYIGIRYPYAKYSQVCVQDFMFGGMENISATTQTYLTLHEPSSEPILNSEPLMAHELAHQWWGNLVTCSDWSQIWLNEGFATYFEAMFTEFDKGEDEFALSVRQDQDAAMEADQKQLRPVVYNQFVEPLDLFFSGHVYPGAASRLHMLRRVLGDDRFRKGIQAYAQKFRAKNATTEDFRLVMEEASGESLGRFFQQWFYSPGFPQLKIETRWDEENASWGVSVEQVQESSRGIPEIFETPVDFEFVFGDQAQERQRYRVKLSQRRETFLFRLPAKPLLFRLDPDGWLLKTVEENKSPDELLYQLSRDPKMIGRLEAARSIKGWLASHADADPLTRQKFADGLLNALRVEKFYGVRLELVNGLASVPQERVLNELLLALKDPDARVRRKVIWALGHFQAEPKVWNNLKSIFQSEPNALVAAEVLTALERARFPDLQGFLERAYSRDSDADSIRVACLNAWVQSEQQLAFSMVMSAAQSPDSSFPLRVKAMQHLAKQGMDREEARALLIRFLDHNNTRIRNTAAESLSKIASANELASLKSAYTKEPYPLVRRNLEKAILHAMKQSQDPSLRREISRLQSQKQEVLSRKRRMESKIEEQKGWAHSMDQEIAELDAQLQLLGVQ